jgi:3-oxoacyl-[acyl-carrier-protein] synthase-3
MAKIYSSIIGTGSYIPELKITTEDFREHLFLDQKGQAFNKSNQELLAKFEEITGITERRYAPKGINTSDMGFFAAEKAIEDAGIDPETLDQIIVAHNFGNVEVEHNYYDLLPNLAARVKNRLGIKNSNCIAYDILYGCPGWLQGMIQADLFIKSGAAKRILIIGTDTVARVTDKYDRDQMLFSDGAGATVVEGVESGEPTGVLAHKAISDCGEEVNYLCMGPTFNQEQEFEGLYIKMNGRNVFRYGLDKIPGLAADCLKLANMQLEDIRMLLFHQANRKMIEQMAKRIYGQKGHKSFPEESLPINVDYMGNNSVATIPILMDNIRRGEFPGHEINSGDNVVFASVGAGMHANCMVYKF